MSRFAPDFRRFLPAWLAFGLAVGWAVFALAGTSVALSSPEVVGISDFPPIMVWLLSLSAHLGGLVIGAVVVPFRRFVVGPRFPFVRRGYALVALIPLLFLLMPASWIQRIYVALAFEVLFALIAVIFVLLGRLFGAFDEEERLPANKTA